MGSLLDTLHRCIPVLQHLVVPLQHLQLLLNDRTHHALSNQHVSLLVRHHRPLPLALPRQLVQHPVYQQSHLYRLHVLHLLAQ